MSNGNARYSWTVVRRLKENGVDDIPQPHVPDQYGVDMQDLDKAEETFEDAIEFCKNRPKGKWRNQYGITEAEAARRQLEAALDMVRKEKQRYANNQSPGSGDDDLSLTVTHPR